MKPVRTASTAESDQDRKVVIVLTVGLVCDLQALRPRLRPAARTGCNVRTTGASRSSSRRITTTRRAAITASRPCSTT